MIHLSKNSNRRPMGASGRQRWGSVAAFGDNGGGHRIKGGGNLRAPSSRNPLRSLWGDDEALTGAGQMESQTLGLCDRAGRDRGKKIELRIELGHIDRHGCVDGLPGSTIEVGAVAVEPKAVFVNVETLKPEPMR